MNRRRFFLLLISVSAFALVCRPVTSYLLLWHTTSVAKDAEQKDQFMGVDAIRRGTKLVSVLSQYDKPTTAVAPARLLMRHAIALWPNWTTFIMSSGHDLARYIPQLTEIRVEGGDTNALDEYAAWIKSADEEKVDEYANEAFNRFGAIPPIRQS
jgi:hypothetical protein